MKIAFISMCNLYLCPYLSKYLDVIRGKADFDVIYWDKHHTEERPEGVSEVLRYEARFDDQAPKWKKLLGMIGYSRYVKKLITDRPYDLLVFLHTNSAILLYGTLLRRYAGRYVMDIRDYSMEHNPLYFRMEEQLVHHSAVNFISSEGYKTFLPKADYYLVHNSADIPADFVQEFRKNRRLRAEPISISFIGFVRFFEQDAKVAAQFGHDPRFRLNYFGKNAYVLREKLRDEHYESMCFVDQFPPEQTLEFYKQTDIINNAYGNHTPSLDYAYSNKLYYSAILGLPILVSPGTFMEEVAKQYRLGFVLDVNDPDAPDKLYRYYREIDWDAFDRNCTVFCEKIAADNAVFVQKLEELLQ